MNISARIADERVADVRCDDASLIVDLADGRTISVPLAWYPRLLHATPEQRAKWERCGGGYGIHWPDIDEDLNTEGLLRGAPAPSGRSSAPRGEGKAFKQIDDADSASFPRSDENAALEGPASLLSVGEPAFIVTDSASGRYEPDDESAVRIAPPYGEEVTIIDRKANWILVKWAGKRAWFDQTNLANLRPPKRANSSPDYVAKQSSNGIEIGSRGGVFTRTRSGHRRYF